MSAVLVAVGRDRPPVTCCDRRHGRSDEENHGDVASNERTTERRRFRPCDTRRAPPSTMTKDTTDSRKIPGSARSTTTTTVAASTNAAGLPRGSNPKLASPLRYPGAKRRLLPVITKLLDANLPGTKPVFVEPFAGGASVALGLLDADQVASVVLGEVDPMLAAFWRVVTGDPDWLINKVKTAEITLAEWHRLHADPGTGDRDLAWACLFLNRTSYSGILHPQAGPIGGPQQRSEYKIDCRFPRTSLTFRLERIRRWVETRPITVFEGDYRDLLTDAKISSANASTPIVAYLDPPFYEKAKKLYRRSFTDSDHEELAKELKALSLPWILSYDHAQTIADLYADHGSSRLVEMTYVASTGRSATRELIMTNLKTIPDDDRLEILS